MCSGFGVPLARGGGVGRGVADGGLLDSARSKVFLTVTRLYFGTDGGGERSVCLTFAFLFLLLAMLVQVVPEGTLELGLEPGTCIRGVAWTPAPPRCKLVSGGCKWFVLPAHCK